MIVQVEEVLPGLFINRRPNCCLVPETPRHQPFHSGPPQRPRPPDSQEREALMRSLRRKLNDFIDEMLRAGPEAEAARQKVLASIDGLEASMQRRGRAAPT